MKINFLPPLLIVIAGLACSFSTANMSSFKTSKDADGKQETTSFKAGETIYANAVISNSPGKVSVKVYVTADDAPGMKKGETVKGSEVKIDLPGSGTAKYSLPIPADLASGKFTVVADMLNENGEKKDSKSVAINIEGAAPPASKTDTHKDDKPAAKDDKTKDEDQDNN